MTLPRYSNIPDVIDVPPVKAAESGSGQIIVAPKPLRRLSYLQTAFRKKGWRKGLRPVNREA